MLQKRLWLGLEGPKGSFRAPKMRPARRWQCSAVQCWVGRGGAGQGRAGQGRARQGRARQGRARQGSIDLYKLCAAGQMLSQA